MTTPMYELGTLKQSAKILTLFEETPREQIQALIESGLLANLRDANIAEIDRKEFQRICGLKPKVEGNFRYDKRNDNWKLLENTPRRLTSANNVEAASFLKKGEGCIGGEELVRRARTEFDANLGQEDAEFMLEHQAEIPKELRKYYLVFPGTIWQDAGGFRYVPSLRWRDGRWILGFGWLGDGWGSGGRLVRPRKPACR